MMGVVGELGSSLEPSPVLLCVLSTAWAGEAAACKQGRSLEVHLPPWPWCGCGCARCHRLVLLTHLHVGVC